jgi:sn-glycerol 3-phosphate transport system ATP-binding protein
MADVQFRNVKKSYGTNAVVHGVDLRIEDGEFLVIVGPSGCGKSTLLRMVAGLEPISAGEILIDGKVVNDLEPKDRDIAMVFQNYALYPHMSVFENMAYGLKIRGFSKDDIRKRVDKAAGILELGGLLDRKPKALSGGQRQRVAMGRAIVREPKVFLFDEPLSNLDAKLRVEMRLEIQKLHSELGTTCIYVTHDQIEAMTLSDRMMVMNAGRVEHLGTPEQVYSAPATRFVANFIGTPAMTFLPGQMAGSRLELKSGLNLPISKAPATVSRDITLGVRPEHWDVVSANDAMFSMRADMVEWVGADAYAYGQLGGQTIIVRLPEGVRMKVGDTLHLRYDEAHVHWFDTETGVRV